MTAQNPSSAGGPLLDGPRDPEHDPAASYALEPEYVDALTRRIVSTTGVTAETRSPLNGAAAGAHPAVVGGRRRRRPSRGPASPGGLGADLARDRGPRCCCACTT